MELQRVLGSLLSVNVGKRSRKSGTIGCSYRVSSSPLILSADVFSYISGSMIPLVSALHSLRLVAYERFERFVGGSRTLLGIRRRTLHSYAPSEPPLIAPRPSHLYLHYSRKLFFIIHPPAFFAAAHPSQPPPLQSRSSRQTLALPHSLLQQRFLPPRPPQAT